MSVSIAISPLSTSLEMYGEPDTSSAYSLSGHVSISLTSQASMFETRRATRLLLQSLTITFEGQSEVVTREIGYAPLRLCSMTRELAPNEPLELSNEGHEHSDKPCAWNVVFNLPVPGWLPTTSTYGDWSEEGTGTSYALYATAKFASLDDESDRSWSFQTLCSLFRPKSKVVYAEHCPITLSRFMNPPSIPASESLFPMANFALRPELECLPEEPKIPADIISKIQALMSIPEHIPADATSMPFTIRLRTSDLSEEDTKRLRLSAFSVDVQQQERYRYVHSGMPSRDFSTHYPIPSLSNQPPNRALLAPHRLSTLFETGLLGERRNSCTCVTRTFSLMDDLEPMTYEIAGDGCVFADDYPARDAPTWYTVKSTVPLAARSPRARQRRVSERTPLFGVSHEVRVSLMCSYDAPGMSEPLRERLSFTIPVQFANVTPTATHPENLLDLSPASSRSASPLPPPMAMPKSLPYAHSLPAYSQLFDSNGDRKIDYSIPLPLYTPEDQAADALPLKSP
ncbi:hypothetical protein FIBSPDRAFT_741119 [Athelia psychrophila]|uniref:Arrestin-like N-terminal domain-containing protein n=1 Tax=Athelia psychrophila TaxID=1759441 RepID=A0A166JU27_9AGAM|nr:hypothetical protein FIBSPDRAFT_741119 [Fibularhizoctonia sp. CBS 109695]